MELLREDLPLPEAPFFTKDQYDKYSLAPSVRDLWAFLQRPADNADKRQKCDAAKASSSATTEEYTDEVKDGSKDYTGGDDSDNAMECAEDCKDTMKTKGKDPVKNQAEAPYPEPRLPFPCMSSLSCKEQMAFVHFLRSKKAQGPSQNLQERVNVEVMQFMRYLQDVSRICADDYSFISPGAMQYSEEFFECSLENMKKFPQLYQIHEMTSLTGGTFNQGLKFTFEKQLLIMGTVDITDHQIVPADAQLAMDYSSVSSECPPAKKAKDMHAAVSNDTNAERLSARYEPHVCLTRDALVRLLDNHGPDFVEQWELPVWVRATAGKGSIQKKTVYIDSPLLKTEATVRERSQLYHEESLKLSIKRDGSKDVFHVMTQLPAEELQSPERCQRTLVSLEDNGLDFEVDLTDLETFGETISTKSSKTKCAGNKKTIPSSPLNLKRSSDHLVNTSSSSTHEACSPLAAKDDWIRAETAEPEVSQSTSTNIEAEGCDSAEETSKDKTTTADSDDERLVIDDPSSLAAVAPPLTHTSCSVPEPIPEPTSSRRRQPKRAKEAADQLGEILRMQTAMFTSAGDMVKSQAVSSEAASPARLSGPSAHSHTTSLVKPCVSSYLEKNHNQSEEAGAAAPAEVQTSLTPQKKILSQDLQAGMEDESDYSSPEEGNLLYQLYSLQDLLLLVRSSITLTHSRRLGSSQNQYVPVHVLPKLEYQLCYGVESLTRSEACRLWAESALHSSTASYVAHINAHTSKVALLRKLPDDWKQNISCGFKPSKSLNILHHLVKKLTGLEEGRYLMGHKSGEPFVTLLKATEGKAVRGAFNLKQVHSSTPQPPASAPPPWIPVDHAVLLPFHHKHGRVPCTFPPRPPTQAADEGPSHTGKKKAKKKKKKGKGRGAQRDTYIKKLVQMSV